jgi:hypothetical protein
MYVGGEEAPGMTPEAIAADHGAIRYCESNPPEIRADWEADEALAVATGMNESGYGSPRILSPQGIAQLRRP